MTDFAKWFKTTAASAQTTGTKPRMRDYFLVKVSENLFVILLLGLAAVLWAVGSGVVGTIDSQAKTFTQHLAELCFGVFLGTFTGKKV